MHVEHACQQCWDNQKQLDELKEANELKKKTIETLIAIREAQDRFYGFEPTARGNRLISLRILFSQNLQARGS